MLYTNEKSPETLICKELQGFYLKSGGQNAPKDFNLLNIIKLQLTENMDHRLVRKGKNFYNTKIQIIKSHCGQKGTYTI